MKLKVAVLDHDEEFIKRFAEAFRHKYQNEVTLSLFSDQEILYENMPIFHPDIILFDEMSVVDRSRIPDKAVCGYFCKKMDIIEKDGCVAICKYQKVENIYKMLLGLYAENSAGAVIVDKTAEVRKVLFTSVQGGCGTSAAAAAYAVRCAADGKKVLYVNLEKFGNSNLYFTDEGNLSFSDVIYFLKSRKDNLLMKLESIVQRDSSGVEFFNGCKNAYDMFELQDEELWSLIKSISQMEKYDEIVMDLSGDMDTRMTGLMTDYADRIIYVTDGSTVGKDKFRRFCEVVKVMEDKMEYDIMRKMVLIYNRFSSRTSEQFKESPVPVLGGIHRYEGLPYKEICSKISETDFIREI